MTTKKPEPLSYDIGYCRPPVASRFQKGVKPQRFNSQTTRREKAIQLVFALLQVSEPMLEAQKPIETILVTGVLAEGARTI